MEINGTDFQVNVHWIIVLVLYEKGNAPHLFRL